MASDPATVEPPPPEMPALHASARFLPGTWQRYDETGGVSDRWTFTPDGTFSIWSKIVGGGAFFGDFNDVSGTYSATDEMVHLSGTTREGWPFRYDFDYFSDETQLVRAPFVLTEITSSTTTWTAVDDVILYPPVSSYPFENRMNPTLVFHTEGPEIGEYKLTWIDPIWDDGRTEHGTFQNDDTFTLSTWNHVRVFDLADPRALVQHVDTPWMFGLRLGTFFHPMLLGLSYTRVP
ncbi:MAG: hypothetical protein ABIY55_05795 [Kofleriaceae bacterium]